MKNGKFVLFSALAVLTVTTVVCLNLPSSSTNDVTMNDTPKKSAAEEPATNSASQPQHRPMSLRRLPDIHAGDSKQVAEEPKAVLVKVHPDGTKVIRRRNEHLTVLPDGEVLYLPSSHSGFPC
jgi:hypothetical protein